MISAQLNASPWTAIYSHLLEDIGRPCLNKISYQTIRLETATAAFLGVIHQGISS
jgi:DNA-binding protein Fis